MNEIKPIIEKVHNIGNGIQKIYRFENGYGALVFRFKIIVDSKDLGYGSYTNNEQEWELIVIKFKEKDNNYFSFVYDTEITNSILGYLSDKEVQKTLKKIKKLK